MKTETYYNLIVPSSSAELCTVRHRGAFEQAYVGFSSLCGALWRSPDPELNKYPSYWLNELIGKITDGAVSSTRRSAGLPFIVQVGETDTVSWKFSPPRLEALSAVDEYDSPFQSVVVTEPEANNGSILKQAMAALLHLAESEGSEVARVHALNVLRVLFK